jgi:hypothetical protein
MPTAPTVAPRPATGTVAPTTAPASTAAPAAAAAVPTGTLRYANADFSNESTDPINLESTWGFTLYDSLLTFDAHTTDSPS